MNVAVPLEILVEELSAEVALWSLLPKIIPGVAFEIRSFRGKPDLLKKLPHRLAGYAAWPGKNEARIVVLVDRDDEDCVALREQLDTVAAAAGFSVRGSVRSVVSRIAVEELEAWFFGDMKAVAMAFPRIPVSLAEKSAFREPDAIRGGTAEAFGRIPQQYGYRRGGLAKVSAAQTVSAHMDVDNNRSKSFQVFRDGLRRLTQIEVI